MGVVWLVGSLADGKGVCGRQQEAEVRVRQSCFVVIQDEDPGEVILVHTVGNGRTRKPNGAFIPDPTGPRALHMQVSLACPQWLAWQWVPPPRPALGPRLRAQDTAQEAGTRGLCVSPSSPPAALCPLAAPQP